MIELIIRQALKRYKKKLKVNISDLPKKEIDQIKYYLFVHNFDERQSDWADFFPIDLTRSLSFEVTNLSLLLFIDNGIDIFVVVGGKGFQLVVPYIDHTFGLTVVSKVLKPEEDLVVSVSSRGLTGSRSGMSEQFRNEFKIIDFARFGKVPVKIHLELSHSISNTYFSFLQNKKNERIKIYAGKAFKVKKNLNFRELHQVIIELGFILELEENDYLSTYIEIKNRRHIKNELEPLLLNALFNDLENFSKTTNIGDKRFKFDFCNPEKIIQFYEADYFILKEKVGEKKYQEFDKVENREGIYESVMKRALQVVGNNDFFTFRAYIHGVRVLAYSDGKLAASSGFIYHFTSEFTFEGQPIFLVDTKWYKLNASFVDDLKYECVRSIRNKKLPSHILKLPWDKSIIRTEGEYSLRYSDIDKYLVLDTLTPEGIELCDIMYIEEGITYLIHVKYGFDSSLRELSNQIELSAQRLYEDSRSGKFKYVDKIFEHIKLKWQSKLKYDREEFRSLLSKKKIVYVFAFASQLFHDDLVEENIDKYRSNIARYSLVQCSKNMQNFMFDLNIWQIRRK
ncbi:MAG: DUF6119 family protein [Saprospiraceae bacterium]